VSLSAAALPRLLLTQADTHSKKRAQISPTSALLFLHLGRARAALAAQVLTYHIACPLS